MSRPITDADRRHNERKRQRPETTATQRSWRAKWGFAYDVPRGTTELVAVRVWVPVVATAARERDALAKLERRLQAAGVEPLVWKKNAVA